MVFQDPYASLNPRMSIFDIIAEPLIIHGLTKSKKELEDRVMELLRKVGLDDYRATNYHDLFPAASASVSESPGPWQLSRS